MSRHGGVHVRRREAARGRAVEAERAVLEVEEAEEDVRERRLACVRYVQHGGREDGGPHAPEPLYPTMATVSPALIVKLTLRSAGCVPPG